MERKCLAALLLLAAAFATHATGRGPRAVRESIEASMLLTGTIEVDAAGSVEGFELDARDKIPEPVTRLLDQVVPQWRFEPTLVDGQPAAVRTPMRVRVVANRVPGDDDSYALRVGGASFGETGPGGLRADRMDPPIYPHEPLQKGVQGTVFLMLRIGRSGMVEDVIAEQVNLKFVASERTMRRMRTILAKAAIRASADWKFTPPTAGDDVDAPHWSARVPVDFALDIDTPGYGEWTSYVPGPREVAPWQVMDDAVGADSFVSNGVYPVGKGLKLLSPLDGSG